MLYDLGFHNQCANFEKANANKRKQIKANLLSFVFFYFLESGLFKGLRPKKIKNSLSLPTSRVGLWSDQVFKQLRALSAGVASQSHGFRPYEHI
jgi:hypothetical protein